MTSANPSSMDQLLRSSVEAGDLPGLAAVAYDVSGACLYSGCFGLADGKTGRKLDMDTRFQIASCTKLVTAIATLQLLEEGKLQLSDPVKKYLPNIAAIQVLRGYDGDKPVLVDQDKDITIHHLFTQTSGMSYSFLNEHLLHWANGHGIPLIGLSTKETYSLPLIAQPGERFSYGLSTDWLGFLVEKIRGQKLQDVFQKHIFSPLGMKNVDPYVRLPDTTVHLKRKGEWKAYGFTTPDELKVQSGGSMLYASPQEFSKLVFTVLNQGLALNGYRVLQAATVQRYIFSNQINLEIEDIVTYGISGPKQELLPPGIPRMWSYGGLVNGKDVDSRRRKGSVAWHGALNTYWFVDPTTGICGTFFTQVLPTFAAPAVNMSYAFESALYKQASRFNRGAAL